MPDKISMSELGTWLTDIVEKEALGAEEVLDEVLHNRALQLRGKLRARSPKDTGDYAKGWRMKIAQRNHEKVRVVYNAAKPGLTFLLEYGTRKMEQRPHIRLSLIETYDEILEELLARL